MSYNLELQVFPDHFSCVVFPRNYRLSKIHFRVFALVKALKFNLSSMISRNSAFSNSIISTHKDLREILPQKTQSDISTFISIIKLGSISIINALQAKNKMSLNDESEPSSRLTQHRQFKKLFLAKARLLKRFEPRYFLYKFLKMGCVLSMHQICDAGQKNRSLSRPYF